MPWFKDKTNQIWIFIKGKWVTLAVAIGLIGTIGVNVILQEDPISEDYKLKAPKEKILKSKEIDWEVNIGNGHIQNRGKIIKYDYVSDELVEMGNRNGIHEDISRRTQNAKFFKTGKIVDGKEEVIMNAYVGMPFHFDTEDQKWKEVKVATTTVEAFDKQMELTWFDNLKNWVAYATTFSETRQATNDPTFTEGSISANSYADTLASENTTFDLADSGGAPANKYKLDFTFDGTGGTDQWGDYVDINELRIEQINFTLEAADSGSTDDYYLMLWDWKSSAWDEIGAVMSIGAVEDTYERQATTESDHYVSNDIVKVRIANGKALGKGGAPNNDGLLEIDYMSMEIQNSATSSYAVAGDGMVALVNATWDTVHDATTCGYSPSGDAQNYAGPIDTTYNLGRAFIPIYTGDIPSGSTITSSTLYLNWHGVYDSDNDAQAYMTIVQTDQGDETDIVNDDYNNCGATNNPDEAVDAANRKDLTYAAGANGWDGFDFNATGRGWIKVNGAASNCGVTAGYTCLGLREGHDTEDLPNVDTSAVYVHTFEAGAQKPYLSIVYSAEPPPVPDIPRPPLDIIIFD